MSTDVHRVFLSLLTACSSRLRLLHDANPPRADFAIENAEGIRARNSADDHHLGDVTLVLYLLRGARLFLSQKYWHLLLVEHQIEPRLVHADGANLSLERFAIAADLIQDEVYPIALVARRKVRLYASLNPSFSHSLEPVVKLRDAEVKAHFR